MLRSGGVEEHWHVGEGHVAITGNGGGGGLRWLKKWRVNDLAGSTYRVSDVERRNIIRS